DLFRRAERQLEMRAVHRVAGLEGDDLAPAELPEALPHLARRVAQMLEVVMRRGFDTAQLTADVHRMRLAHQIADGRMRLVGRAEDALGLADLVGPVDVRDL